MERLGEVRAVTFDVGGTLIAPWPSVGHVYGEVAARHGLRKLDIDKLNQQFAAAWEAKAGFDYSRAAWSELVSQTFDSWIKPDQQVQFFDELYDQFAQPEAWRIFDDVLPAIEMLIERGMELGIISNWDERLRPLLQRLKLDRYFRVTIISQEIGFHKPSSVIFHEAARKFACPAHCVLHVGDGQLEDFDGARQAGLQGVLLTRRPSPARENKGNVIRSLAELEYLLE
jgi:putative hydrolase of the HAD superfamily